MKKAIDQFTQRGIDYLESQLKDSITHVQNKLNLLNQSIDNRTDSIAQSVWIPANKLQMPEGCVAPNEMRFGTLQLLNLEERSIIKDLDIPLLLPTNTNAVLLNMMDDADKVPHLFQNLILRLLLSMRMNLVKVSIVDMDFGSSFPFISSITNPTFQNKIIYHQDGINKLLEELALEISEANKNYLGRYPNIDSYNDTAGDMAFPYHFVFLDDFPNGFTQQAIDNLLRLIDHGNASKAGIKIFINYHPKNPHPHNFPIRGFTSICACVNKDSNGSLSLENFGLKFPLNVNPQLELNVTTNVTDYIGFINTIRPKTISYTLDSWINDLKINDLIWKETTINGIDVPIGFVTPTQHFNFYMANDNDSTCNDFFALIAGRPGYGKTVLLHNIIINAAMKYSPEELCLYLADFAEGASFSIYQDLPHAKSLMLANNKEYALRMLDDIILETKKRSYLYKKAQKEYGRQITKLSEYREVTKAKLPRILFIMDEFHTLFLSTDSTTISAREKLCNGIRQWRKFGISIILCTQSINGVNFGNADTHITYRFALNLLELDSKSVLRNNAAMFLTRKGQTIMNNTADGNSAMNIEFQSAFTSQYVDHVNYLSSLYIQHYGKKHTPYICESEVDADVSDNQILITSIIGAKNNVNNQYCDVFVGKPDLLRNTHTKIRYRRQQNSNTLIIGDDYRTLVYNVMTQLIQLKNNSFPNSRFYLIDCFNVGDRYKNALQGLENLSNAFVTISSDTAIAKYIDDIYAEMELRKLNLIEGKMINERVVLVIMNTQNSYNLKSQLGRFGKEQSESAKKLINLLSDGATLGIHCIIHALSYDTLFKMSGILDGNKHFSMFENLILLKGADTSNMQYHGIKANAPDEEGRMIVFNAKIDGETYEQCNAYSYITLEVLNDELKFMSNIFDNYRYV